MRSCRWLLPGISVCFLIAFSQSASAAAEVSTFASLYEPEIGVGWAMSALIAVAVGLVVLLGLMTVWPTTIAAIGTAIGSMFGLSGAAATNFGLALLGGGSIASGGGGIAAGTALLATALTFSTEVAIDYTMVKATAAYDRAAFERESLTMMTLPLPVEMQTGGLESLDRAKAIMGNSLTTAAYRCVRDMPVSVEELGVCLQKQRGKARSELTQASLAEIRRHENRGDMTLADVERKDTAIAVLLFLGNDYQEAAEIATRTYFQGRKNERRPTVAAFIMSIERLYDERPDFAKAHDLFVYAISAESTNPLTPVLFAIYLDRLSARVNQGAAGVEDLNRLTALAQTLPQDERRLMIQQTLLTHYIKHIKLTQQKVLSLATMRDLAPQLHTDIRQAMQLANRDHWRLLAAAKALLQRQERLIEKLERTSGPVDRALEGKNPFGAEPTRRQRDLRNLKAALVSFETAINEYELAKRDLSRIAKGY